MHIPVRTRAAPRFDGPVSAYGAARSTVAGTPAPVALGTIDAYWRSWLVPFFGMPGLKVNPLLRAVLVHGGAA